MHKLIVSLLLVLAAPAAAEALQESKQGVEPFELRTPSAEMISVGTSETDRFIVVAFLGNECPLAKLYAVRLNELSRQFSDIRFVGINSNRQDSEEELAGFIEALKVSFPMAKDHRNQVADNFGAERTPEIFVLNKELNIVYRGRIDDQYQPGVAKPQPTRHDLRLALEELVAGKPVSKPRTEVEGCIIGRVKQVDEASSITFSNQISRVLQKHCVECHRAGDIGPFSLTDYEEVAGWGDMLVEVVDDGRMPPWHADPKHGDFSNARHMPESDKKLLRDWVAAGAPFGNPKELPPIPKPMDGWRLPGKPDAVFEMRDRPFSVPAEGTVDYQYFVVDPGFKEDKWVVASEIIPGNRSVVHHSIVFVRPPDGTRFNGLGWLTAYVPGQRETTYPPGHGRRIPAGSKLVFQQHYTPVGSKQDDITKIGLVFADEAEIKHEVFTTVAIEQEFEIPPNADAHSVNTFVRGLPKKGKLFGFAPHMHYRGKSCQVHVESEGEGETLMLNVPKYDFNWQHSYSLKEPLDLASVKRIKFTATFDNSADNPVNPDPSRTIYWGDQTWEEMVVAFFDVAVPRGEGVYRGRTNVEPEFSEAEKKAANQFVDEFFERFDKDKNGTVARDELPHAMRREYLTWNFNGTVGLQKEEVYSFVENDFSLQEERQRAKNK